MFKKTICACLLTVLCFLLFGCGDPSGGKLPNLPSEDDLCTVTYIYNLPPSEEPREYVEKVLRGGLASPMSLPGDEQYEMEGWYCGDKKWDFIRDPVTEDIRLEVNWTRREYTVGYRIGDYVRADLIVYYGEKAFDPYLESPERFDTTEEWKDMKEQGYVFVGWTYEGRLWNFETDTVTKNIVLDACFLPADEIN
jgi:hypothetical protein